LLADGGQIIDSDRTPLPYDELSERDIIRHTEEGETTVYSYRAGDQHITVKDDGDERIVYETPRDRSRVVPEQHLPTIPANWERVQSIPHPQEDDEETVQIYNLPAVSVWVRVQHPRPVLEDFMYVVEEVGETISPSPADEQLSDPSEFSIDGQLPAEYYLRGLLGVGCTPTKAMDYYFVKIHGMGQEEWRESERNTSENAVYTSIRKAQMSLWLNKRAEDRV
jgi:hypothetical protein